MIDWTAVIVMVGIALGNIGVREATRGIAALIHRLHHQPTPIVLQEKK